MSEVLKPCPFCGSPDAAAINGSDDHGYEVLCTCSAYGPYRLTEAEAIAAWNTRLSKQEDEG